MLKKILHITQATGGVKTFTSHVLEYADANLYTFVIAAPEDSNFEPFCQSRSIPYYTVDLERSINPINNLTVLFKIISIIRKERPDLIHAHSAKGGFLGRIAAKFTGCKIIYTPHAFSYLPFTGLKRILFYFLEYSVRNWTTMLLAISNSEAKKAIYELGYKPNKVTTVMNSIPINSGLPAKNYKICLNINTIGRLTNQKNPMLFLRIAERIVRKYPAVRFSILGAGIHDDLNREIDEFIAINNLQNNVFILGWGNEETSSTFLQDADIFVLTSIFEGLPYSLLEAMATGAPCVVSKVDGNIDVVQNGENGYSCSDLDEFCIKIETLISSEEERRRLGEAGRRYVAKFHGISVNIKKVDALYARVLAA